MVITDIQEVIGKLRLIGVIPGERVIGNIAGVVTYGSRVAGGDVNH
jgi:hypothetical protein